jgi:hypothetical protein
MALLLLNMHLWWNSTHRIISSILGQIFKEFTFSVEWAEFFEFWGLRCWNGTFVAKYAFMMKFHLLDHFPTIESDFDTTYFVSVISWIFWILMVRMRKWHFCCWTCIHGEIPLIASSFQYWVRFSRNLLFQWNEMNFLNFEISDAEMGVFLLNMHSWWNYTDCIISSILGQIFKEFTFSVEWAEFFEFQGLRCWNGTFVAKQALMMKLHWLHHLFNIGSDFQGIYFFSGMSWIFWILRSCMLKWDFCC